MDEKKQFNAKVPPECISTLEEKYKQAHKANPDLKKGDFLANLMISAVLNENSTDPDAKNRIDALELENHVLTQKLSQKEENILVLTKDNQALTEKLSEIQARLEAGENVVKLDLTEAQALELWQLTELAKVPRKSDGFIFAKSLEEFIFNLIANYREHFKVLIITPDDLVYLKSLQNG